MPDSKVIDVGVALHSPSAEFMKLVNIHDQQPSNSETKWTDFTTIVQYIQKHLYDIIYEVHHVYDKLLIDDMNTQINCPPEEPSHYYNDSNTSTTTTINHTTLILRALSEKELPNGNGIIAKRDIKVYDCGITTTGTDNNNNTNMNNNDDDFEYHTIQIREDIIKSSNDETNVQPILYENEIQIIVGKKKTK